MKGKKLFSITLICALIISVIFSSTDVSAGSKRFLEIGYKGETVTVFNGRKVMSLKTAEKAWGKSKKRLPSKVTFNTYIWKTKKTRIQISGNLSAKKDPGFSSIVISIKDKNGSMAGVKIGMTKEEALEILKKKYGSRNIKVINSNRESFIRINTLDLNEFYIKSGKIVKMSYFIS